MGSAAMAPTLSAPSRAAMSAASRGAGHPALHGAEQLVALRGAGGQAQGGEIPLGLFRRAGQVRGHDLRQRARHPHPRHVQLGQGPPGQDEAQRRRRVVNEQG
ncbi:MAG TPA: hypothetical protein VFE59_17795 [Trebonia sp.]|nr:hypothetical protein [Trebonia sp.]